MAEQPPGPVILQTARFDAVLFDLDGVVTDTASVHAAAWTQTFDTFLRRWSQENGVLFDPFTPQDYLLHIDGRPRTEAIRDFMAHRGVPLPEGDPSDGPERDTVHGLSARKNQLFLEHIRNNGVDVYPATVSLIQHLRALGIKTGLVTASRNRAEILRVAGLQLLFDATVDGNDRATLNLRGKPAPDTFLEAARRLGAEPARSIVVEDAIAGVAAGHAGGFGFVIGVDRAGEAEALHSHGADVVVSDLADVELQPAAPASPATVRDRPDRNVHHLGPSARAGKQRRHFDAASEPDGWTLTYGRFEPAIEGRRETLLATGNGYFVTRGAAAEATADGVHYPGTYLAGGYNRLTTVIGELPVEHEDLVNLPNWLSLNFCIDDGEWFDLKRVDILTYRHGLDLRNGVHERVVSFRDPAGRQTRIVERRLVHMRHQHLAAQHVQLIAENWSGRLGIRVQLDGNVINAGVFRYLPFSASHLRVGDFAEPDPETVLLETETTQSRLRISQAMRVRADVGQRSSVMERKTVRDAGQIVHRIDVGLVAGDHVEIEKLAALYTSRDRAISDGAAEARTALERAGTFDDLLRSHSLAWHQLWRRCDMEVAGADGDASHDIQRIVRVHIFHLLQTASPHTTELDVGIPARGWHGEGYRGHIFWDELFIFPFLNLRLPELTRALLLYRYRRLPEARWAARAAGYAGAMFPWQSGSNGREETDVKFLNPRSGNWIRDDTRLQRHIGAAVAYNVWQYYQATGDSDFLYSFGAELLFEIARFWASAATWNEARGRYDIRGIMGPDEFHDRYPDRPTPGLDNNAYTNVMASWCLTRALGLLADLPADRRHELCESLDLQQAEIERWELVSRKLYVPFHGDGILSQFEDYESLKEFEWTAYRHKYDNIMRLDLILEAEGESPNRYKLSKQADVLMLFYLFSADELAEMFARLEYRFDPASIPDTIDYYLRRTSHGSTLSGVVHAWVLARGSRRRSWPLFTEALHSDIGDIQGGTTQEGIHLGAMAGTVDLLQRCYTGLELRGEELRFNPVIPDELERLAFPIRYRGHSLSVDVTSSTFTIASDPCSARPICIRVGEQSLLLEPGTCRCVALNGAGRR